MQFFFKLLPYQGSKLLPYQGSMFSSPVQLRFAYPLSTPALQADSAAKDGDVFDAVRRARLGRRTIDRLGRA